LNLVYIFRTSEELDGIVLLGLMMQVYDPKTGILDIKDRPMGIESIPG
jgi:hypothetical protein